MIGAIMGDMIGAPYEFDRSPKTKEFPLFGRGSNFTDDSVMTIAVAEALMDTIGKSDDEIKDALVASMQKWVINIQMPVTAECFTAGFAKRTRSRMGALATARLCGYPLPDGCTILWKRPDTWHG